jgi:hypothetical protein
MFGTSTPRGSLVSPAQQRAYRADEVIECGLHGRVSANDPKRTSGEKQLQQVN